MADFEQNSMSPITNFKEQLNTICDIFQKLTPEQQAEAVSLIQDLHSSLLNQIFCNTEKAIASTKEISTNGTTKDIETWNNCVETPYIPKEQTENAQETLHNVNTSNELQEITNNIACELPGKVVPSIKNALMIIESNVQTEELLVTETQSGSTETEELHLCDGNPASYEEILESNHFKGSKNSVLKKINSLTGKNSAKSMTEIEQTLKVYPKTSYSKKVIKKHSILTRSTKRKVSSSVRDSQNKVNKLQIKYKNNKKKGAIQNKSSNNKVIFSSKGRPLKKKLPVFPSETNANKNQDQTLTKHLYGDDSYNKNVLQLSNESLNDKNKNDRLQKETNTKEKSVNTIISCRFCTNEFETLSEYYHHSCDEAVIVKTVLGQQTTLYKCMLCSMVFSQKHHLYKHIMGHKRNNCKKCNAQFTKRKALCKHMKAIHNISEPEKFYCCHYCDRKFFKRPSLNIHLKKHANGQIVCTKCGTMCENDKAYRLHMENHSQNSKFECNQCGEKFERKQQYEQHMMGHERHLCSVCGITFSTKKLYNKHQQTTHGIQMVEKKHECPTCKKRFQRPIHLRIHQRIHTGERPIQCSHCEKSFRNSRALAKHMKTASHLKHVGEIEGKTIELEKLFLCAKCGAKFYRHQGLVRHMEQLHGSIKPFECPYCDYKCKCKTNLKRHIELHTDNRRFVCEICGSSFHALATLKEHHAYVHSEERGFVCELCSKGFKGRSGLKRHMRIHSDARPYVCHCSQSYKRMSHLKRHMVSAHQVQFKSKRVKKIGDESDTETNLSSQDGSSNLAETLEVLQDHSSCDGFPVVLTPNISFIQNQQNDIILNNSTDFQRISLTHVSSGPDEYVIVSPLKLQSYLDKNDLDIIPGTDSTELGLAKNSAMEGSLMSLISAQDNVTTTVSSLQSVPIVSNTVTVCEQNLEDISSSHFQTLQLPHTSSTSSLLSVGTITSAVHSNAPTSVVPSHSSAHTHDTLLIASPTLGNHSVSVTSSNHILQSHQPNLTTSHSLQHISLHESEAPLSVSSFLLDNNLHSVSHQQQSTNHNHMNPCQAKQTFTEANSLLDLPPYPHNVQIPVNNNDTNLLRSNQHTTSTVWVGNHQENLSTNHSEIVRAEVTAVISSSSTTLTTTSSSTHSNEAKVTSQNLLGHSQIFSNEESITHSIHASANLHSEELDTLSHVYTDGVKQFLGIS